MAMIIAEIERLIKEALPDSEVSIIDLQNDGNHYACHVTSKEFVGKTRIEQHKLVYAALGERMGDELHALALQTTPREE